jgi:hypothetical protein
MRDVALILHNLRDHVVTLRDIYERNLATGDARARLLQHIRAEELENQAEIARIAAGAAPELRRVLGIALDHSRFLCDIIEGKEIAPQLAISLLEHFQEEHDEGHLALPTAPAAPQRPGWTVGSLLGGKP